MDTNMNETPETDELAQLLHNKCSHSESCYYEMRIHARKLERERDEARNEISKWHQMAIEADKRFIEALRERDLEQLKQQP